MNDLASRHCRPRQGPAVQRHEAEALLQQIPGWSLDPEAKEIHSVFTFKNYYETMAFVNAVAWVAHREDHHPDMEVGYSKVEVVFSTHSVSGLSENDFICAAKIGALGVS